MTISSTTSKATYNGNGSTHAFTVPFYFLTDADLVVTLVSSAGVETVQTITTHYTVTGAGVFAGGTVTMITAPASGEKLIIKRSPEQTQETDYVENEAFPAETHERALDLLTMIAQDLQEQIDRAVKAPISSTTAPDDLVSELIDMTASATASAATATTQAGLAAAAQLAAEAATANAPANIKTYGAVCDGITDDAAAVQAAIDYVAAQGGGYVDFPIGTTLVNSTIVLKTGVILRGQGLVSTEMKLGDNCNVDLLQSVDFETLTGSGLWYVSDGVPHGFGFMDIRLNGNKANQTSGNGVMFFGKRIFVERALVFDCYGYDYYSECGDTGGQESWMDIPEGRIAYLNVQSSGSHGFLYRGPHDGNIESVFSSSCGGDGIRLERSAGVYNGGCDIGFIHEYNCAGYGFYSDAMQYRCRHLIAESNGKEGLYFSGAGCQFGMIQLYNNCRTSGTHQGVFTATAVNNSVGSIQLQHAWPGGMSATIGGIDMYGYGNDLGLIELNGCASSGSGLRLNAVADRNYICGNIYGFSATGGYGLITGHGGACNDNELNLSISNNATQWKHETACLRNIYSMTLRCIYGSGQVLMDPASVPPNTINDIEIWDVVGIDQAGNSKKSSYAGSSTTGFTLGAAGVASVTFPHGLLFTPEFDHVSISTRYAGTNATWAMAQPMHVSSIDATNIVVRGRVGTASGTAKTVSGATKANPCVITCVGHGFANGTTVIFASVGGMTQLNTNIYTVANATTDTFELSGVDSSSYGTYTSGGTACPDYAQVAVQARL